MKCAGFLLAFPPLINNSIKAVKSFYWWFSWNFSCPHCIIEICRNHATGLFFLFYKMGRVMCASFLYNRMFYTHLGNIHLRNEVYRQTVLKIHKYLIILDMHNTRWKKMLFHFTSYWRKQWYFFKSWYTTVRRHSKEWSVRISITVNSKWIIEGVWVVKGLCGRYKC